MGTPTDDTFQRIFAIIKPDQLEKCFVNWVKSVCKVQEKEIVSVDGKTLRGSRYDAYSVIHMVEGLKQGNIFCPMKFTILLILMNGKD